MPFLAFSSNAIYKKQLFLHYLYFSLMKIYSPEENYKLSKIILASKLYNKNIHIQKVEFQPKVNKSFKQAYPHYSLPLLETQNGTFLTGVNSILLYIAGQSNLTDSHERIKIIQELQKIERQIDPATGVFLLHAKGSEKVSQQQINKSRQIYSKYLKQLNEKLALKSFISGDRLTVADISIFYNVIAVKSLMEKDIEKLKQVQRWINHIESLVKA